MIFFKNLEENLILGCLIGVVLMVVVILICGVCVIVITEVGMCLTDFEKKF